jgi:glycosyltransferase involved in cell wall biosynthesis
LAQILSFLIFSRSQWRNWKRPFANIDSEFGVFSYAAFQAGNFDPKPNCFNSDLLMKPLRIGIDIHSVGSHKGGNETYYRELVKGLVKIRSGHSFFLYYTSPAIAQHINADDHFTLEALSPAHRMLRIPFTIPRRTRMDQLDLFHAQFIVPPFLKCKTVTTIPDIAYEHYPHFFPTHQSAWLKVLVRESAKRADHIITVSNYSKTDLIRTYGIREEKITVTYEGAGAEFVPLDRERAKEALARNYGINGEFILYVGRLQARKNLMRLVNAYARIRKAGFVQKLVLAGPQDSLFQPVLSRVRELNLENDILMPGYIPSADVPSFYNAAEIFAYPSIYEGFGLPVMEAMACGTAVVTSRGSSLEEVAGDAAVLVNPLDELSIAQALKQVLAQPDLRKQLGEAGLRRSRLFSFENAARQTVGVYEQVMSAERTGLSTQDLRLESRACL